jgi:hypothetical protein
VKKSTTTTAERQSGRGGVMSGESSDH